MIQIDMPMPKNCLDCPACNEYLMCAIPCNGRGWGENDVKDFSKSRPEWCQMTELVRCKDCKHCDTDTLEHCWCMILARSREPDWFCADGERKQNDALTQKG